MTSKIKKLLFSLQQLTFLGFGVDLTRMQASEVWFFCHFRALITSILTESQSFNSTGSKLKKLEQYQKSIWVGSNPNTTEVLKRV